jgi:hypothetical protein
MVGEIGPGPSGQENISGAPAHTNWLYEVMECPARHKAIIRINQQFTNSINRR